MASWRRCNAIWTHSLLYRAHRQPTGHAPTLWSVFFKKKHKHIYVITTSVYTVCKKKHLLSFKDYRVFFLNALCAFGSFWEQLPNVSLLGMLFSFPWGPRFITQVPLGQGAVFGRRSVDCSLRGSMPLVVLAVWFRIKCTKLWQHKVSKPTQGCSNAQPSFDSHNIIIHLQCLLAFDHLR